LPFVVVVVVYVRAFVFLCPRARFDIVRVKSLLFVKKWKTKRRDVKFFIVSKKF
jgi:hypothetical protein